MRSRLLAWTATAVLLSLTGAGTAMADAGATQAVGQTAGNAQTADADASSTQVQPTNRNISVRVLSPGDSGAVSQSNESEAAAAAANANATGQAAQQSQPAAGTQAVGQAAHSSQSADADAASKQIKPTNQNISVRVLSEGDDGAVEQENSSSAAALAANANKTAQEAQQSGGGDDDGGGTQAAGQKADNEQNADADATSVQDRPENVNAPVRVLSEGDGGDVEQENSSKAKSAALNANATKQAATQNQGGGEETSEGKAPEAASAPGEDEGVKQDKGGEDHGAPAIQAVGQKAASDQDAESEATSKQAGAKNVNAPVRVKSHGDQGDAEQSNSSKAGSLAANKNATGQLAKQAQGERDGGGPAVQAIGQLNKSEQDADSEATSRQVGAKNVNAPVGALTRGRGGDVEQSNESKAGSIAANRNATKQAAAQWLGGDDDSVAIQAIGQAAFNDQDADAEATSVQLWPANVNAPVATLGGHGDCTGGEEDRKDAHSAEGNDAEGCHATGENHEGGGEGSVEQDNTSAALSAGLNANWTGQFAVQG